MMKNYMKSWRAPTHSVVKPFGSACLRESSSCVAIAAQPSTGTCDLVIVSPYIAQTALAQF